MFICRHFVVNQNGHFRLLHDHHIQKGPVFPHATDVKINAESGKVTVRDTDKGQDKVETEHLELPANVANGVVLNLVSDVRPDTTETKISYVAASPKPRLIKLSISREAKRPFQPLEHITKQCVSR